MTKVEIYHVSSDRFVSKTGRIFKEIVPLLRGSKFKKYKYVSIEGRKVDIHRLVAEMFLEKVDGKKWVLHIDDDEFNNNIENLKWGTPKENQEDARRNGVFNKHQMRLKKNKEKIREIILDCVKNGLSYSEIQKITPVSISRISQIVMELKNLGLIEEKYLKYSEYRKKVKSRI